MPSAAETRLQALHAALVLGLTPEVLRNAPLPQAVPAAGLVILRDGDPGEPEYLMGVGKDFDHRAAIEIFVQSSDQRETLSDAIGAEISAVIEADRTLGGLCDYIDAVPGEPDDIHETGAAPFRVDPVTVTLSYCVTSLLN